MARKRLNGDPFTLSGETDRVFINTETECRIYDPDYGITTLRKQGSRSTVVWNPWETKSEVIPDLNGGQWSEFVCIETGNALNNAVTLVPGESHVIRAVIERVSG